jgi:hypothetical protein
MAQYRINMDGSWNQIYDTEQTYYVYLLRRPNGKVFYVGKGKGRRIDHHEREAKTDCKCHKCNIIRQAWKRGELIGKEVVFSTNVEREALAREAQIIQSMKDQLVNVLDCDIRLRKPQRIERARRLTKREQKIELCERVDFAMRKLDRRMRRAYLTRDYELQARIEAEMEAYEMLIRPPVQMELEGL